MREREKEREKMYIILRDESKGISEGGEDAMYEELCVYFEGRSL